MSLLAGTKVPQTTRVEESFSREDLIAAIEARDTLLAVAAHELRNAMTPVIGQIELLRTQFKAVSSEVRITPSFWS